MPSLRLLTANLWNGRADPRALADVLAEHAPDALLSQELAPAQAAVIERALPHGLLAPRRDSCGMGLSLRAPASVARLPLPHRDALCARIRRDGAELEIVNVHLSAPTRLPRLALRRAQVRELRAYLSRSAVPRVLAGDLNSLPLMPAYFALCRHLRDAALETSRAPSPTWAPLSRGPRLLRIDHVLVRDVQVHSLEVVRIFGSDHAALLATLRY